ncbi:MAG: tetratricopeptide repeat protein [Pirellulaceae bacterium]|nr:tetratricopeptide repeat protein [Pirellulaceae bacterium]
MYCNRITSALPALVWLAAIVSAATVSAIPALAAPADDQFAVAAGHYRHQRWQLAVDEFQVFLDRFPAHPRAETVRFFRAESLVQLGRYQDAAGELTALIQNSPRHEYARQARFRLGELAYLQGDDPDAQTQLEAFRREHPQDGLLAYVLPYLGDIRLRAEDFRAAETLYAEALRLYPQGALADQCRFGLGKAYRHLGDAHSAERFFRYLTLDDRGSLADDALLQIAMTQYDQQSFDDARRTLDDFQQRHAASELAPRAGYWQGKTWRALKKPAEAAGGLERALEGCQDDELAGAITWELAECLRESGDGPAAEERYQQLVERWPDGTWAADAWQARIQLRFQAGDAGSVERLAAEFETRFAEHRLLPAVRQLRGRAALQAERYEDAGRAFQQLPATDARNAYYLALAELGAGQFEACLKALERIADPADHPDLAAGLLITRASALTGLRRYAEAVGPLEQYLADHPQGADSQRCRARLTVALAQEKRFDDAQRVLDELRAASEDSTEDSTEDASNGRGLLRETGLFLADALLQAGRYKQARSLFEQLADEMHPAPDVVKALAGLGWACFKGQDLAAAEAAFKRLVTEFPDAAQAPEAALMRAVALQRQAPQEQAQQEQAQQEQAQQEQAQQEKVPQEQVQQQAALEAYREVFTNYPDSPQAPQALQAAAQLLEGLDQRAEAEQLLGRGLERYPDYEQADAMLYLRAWLLVDLQRGDDADQVFARLAEQEPGSPYWADATYRLAERAARANDFDQAARLADRLLAAQIDSTVICHALYLKGQVSAAAGKWEAVEEPMARLVREFPASELQFPAQYWRAEAAYRLEQYELAGERFTELARHAEGRQDAWLGMVPLRRAQVLAQQRQWQAAEELARSIESQYPGFRQQFEVDYLLGRCLASRGRFDEARAAYERVVRSPHGGRTETAAMAQWMIGEAWFLQKKYVEAIKAYHRVETLYAFPQWQAAALLQAGKCHECQANWNEAVKLYAQLLKDYPDTRFAAEASRRLPNAKQRSSLTAAG